MSACILEAHRGVSTEYPENTLCALRAAARQGYGMVEVDPPVHGGRAIAYCCTTLR